MFLSTPTARSHTLFEMCQEIISMSMCGILFYSYLLYRINLHPWPRRKIRIEDFGSRTRDEMYRKHRPKVYCGLERSTTGSCFIKPRVYWNLFHPPVEEELCTRRRRFEYRPMRDPRRICMGTNINVTSCMKHIFLSRASISWLWKKKYAGITESRPWDHRFRFVEGSRTQRIKNILL